MPELIHHVFEGAARETSNQEPPVITVRNGETWIAVAATVAVVRTGTAHKPAAAVLLAAQGKANACCVHTRQS
jgi:hypothetical protein